jgi:dTDP-4-amino-4,6-dideoxygalactose transaminase
MSYNIVSQCGNWRAPDAATRWQVMLLDDAAHAHGARIASRRVVGALWHLSLPMGPHLKEDQTNLVIQATRDAVLAAVGG